MDEIEEKLNKYAERVGLHDQDVRYIAELLNLAWQEGYNFAKAEE